MKNEKELLQTFRRLAELSNRSDLDHREKLQHLLHEIVHVLNTEKGSIMTLAGRKYLEVRAATHPDLVGVKQPLSSTSPSTWVFENKQLLYVDHDHPFKGVAGGKYDYKKEAFLLAPVISGGKVIAIISVTDKKGADRFDFQEQSLLLDFAGLMIRDIENYRLTESLKQKKQVLVKKNRELKKLERLRNELFNMLIHDLKGPISNILANIDILSYTVDAGNKEYVTAAQTGCDTLYRMTADLLDIARIESGSLKLIDEKLQADELISEAVARVHAIAVARNIVLQTGLPEEGKAPVFIGDRGMLLRVLQNLITNAIHHSQQGMMVTIAAEALQKKVRFRVIDQGPGIAKEYQTAIFDKFFQVNKKSDGRNYSSGLGLAFCKMAVEAHGGAIAVDSDGKSGSCFMVTLPVKINRRWAIGDGL